MNMASSSFRNLLLLLVSLKALSIENQEEIIENSSSSQTLSSYYETIRKSENVAEINLSAYSEIEFSEIKINNILIDVLKKMVLGVCSDYTDIDKVEVLDKPIVAKGKKSRYEYNQTMTITCISPISKEFEY